MPRLAGVGAGATRRSADAASCWVVRNVGHNPHCSLATTLECAWSPCFPLPPCPTRSRRSPPCPPSGPPATLSNIDAVKSVHAVIDDQNALTQRVLKRCEGRAGLASLISRIMDHPRHGIPFKRGGAPLPATAAFLSVLRSFPSC